MYKIISLALAAGMLFGTAGLVSAAGTHIPQGCIDGTSPQGYCDALKNWNGSTSRKSAPLVCVLPETVHNTPSGDRCL